METAAKQNLGAKRGPGSSRAPAGGGASRARSTKRFRGAWRRSGPGWAPSSVKSLWSPLWEPSRTCRLQAARTGAR
eukprot:7982576-Alexandrium_andersonii.AAC.1